MNPAASYLRVRMGFQVDPPRGFTASQVPKVTGAGMVRQVEG